VTTLLAEPLYTELSHNFTLSFERYSIGAISPYLYIHNTPSGTFTFSLSSTQGVIFTSTFSCAQIKTAMSTTDNYIHAFYPIIPSAPLPLTSGSYTAKLTSSGYTYSSGAFIAWVKQFEDLNNELGYTPIDDSENPLAMRIKVYKRGVE